MTLHCTSEHCRLHKLCATYKADDGKDATVFTDHQKNLTRSAICMGIVCHFFSKKPGYHAQTAEQLNAIHSPNTFRTVGNQFVIPR